MLFSGTYNEVFSGNKTLKQVLNQTENVKCSKLPGIPPNIFKLFKYIRVWLLKKKVLENYRVANLW